MRSRHRRTADLRSCMTFFLTQCVSLRTHDEMALKPWSERGWERGSYLPPIPRSVYHLRYVWPGDVP